MTAEQPTKSWEEGVVQKVQTSGKSPQPTKFDVKKLSALSEMLSEYTLYTPALLYLSVPLTADPADHYVAETGQELPQFALEFDKPIFANLTREATTGWNNTLIAVPTEYWEQWKSWLGTCAFTSRGGAMMTRVRWQSITIPDPLLPTGPVIPIEAIAMESTIGSMYFTQSDRPAATFDKNLVFADTVAFAKAVKSGDNNPYAAAKAATEHNR